MSAQVEPEPDTIKMLTLFAGRHAFVDRYYHMRTGKWVEVDPWNVLEDRGEPPIIVIAGEHPDNPKGKRLTITRDVEAGLVYDTCGYLTTWSSSVDEPDATFEELTSVAKAIGWAGRHTGLYREVMIYYGGTNPLHPALMSDADRSPIDAWLCDGEKWVKKLEEKHGVEYAYSFGKAHVMFEWDFGKEM